MATSDYYSQFETDDSPLPDIFGEDEYTPANEALDDDVDDLGKIDGTDEKDDAGDNAKNDEGDDESSDPPEEGDTENTDESDGDDGGDDNLAAATDQQLEDDSQSADDESLQGGDEESSDDSSSTDMNSDTTGSDPLRSIETKSAYKKKFTKLYGVIIDSIVTMESFTPAYNNKHAKEYYEIENGLSRLKSAIYDICTERIHKMTVDEVLRQYTLCNFTYDTITRKLKEFSANYEAEQRKLNVEKRVKDTASKLARGNQLLHPKRPTTK